MGPIAGGYETGERSAAARMRTRAGSPIGGPRGTPLTRPRSHLPRGRAILAAGDARLPVKATPGFSSCGSRMTADDETKTIEAGAPATRRGDGLLLVLNAGSSSLKFAAFRRKAATLERVLAGTVERVGHRDATINVKSGAGSSAAPQRVDTRQRHRCAGLVLAAVRRRFPAAAITAVGHRVVHGGAHFTVPQRVNAGLVRALRRLSPFDPDHLPFEIELIEALRRHLPGTPQVACFDTAFHRGMPRVAKLLPIPRRYAAQGVERYGFHGLSYAYLVEELRRLDPAAARSRVILAHLGSGASLAAVRRGRSIDTSMGFTPAAGLVMGTRAGDLDPGLLAFLARRGRMTPAQFERMVNHQSGLLGVSGTSSDVRDLLARETQDVRAREALALFCYQARKWIGAYAAVLGGLDVLVFAGGIGENAPQIRARICDGLGFLGLALDRRRNAGNAPLISPASSRVTVRVIRTDEELMIARSLVRVLHR